MMRCADSKRGFTLVEIIVAMMIFSIVAVVALAALVKIIDANKKAQTTQDAVIGLSFALEAMSREIRTGSNIRCETGSSGNFSNPSTFSPQACPSAGNTNNLIVFRSTKVDSSSVPPCRFVFAYLITGSGPYQLKKAEQMTAGNNCSDIFGPDSYSPIVPDPVILTDYSIGVSGGTYPMVFIDLAGYAGVREQAKTYFNVQTAASPRTP